MTSQQSAAPLWWVRKTQILTVTRMELAKNFFSRRGIWIYLLAFAPVLVIGLHAMESLRRPGRFNLQDETTAMAFIFQVYYMRLGVFFGCMGIFTWLFRGEVIQRSLHYYFLAPMRREVLVAGKFLAGAITAIILFGAGVTVSFFAIYAHLGDPGIRFITQGAGAGQLLAYLGTTALAVIGYGSMFLALSLVFKNPIIPAAIMLGWETISAVLPAFLQKLTITFYLKMFYPVAAPNEGGLLSLFTVVTDPVSPWLAVPGLLALSAVVFYFACLRIRRLEISYVAD
jgi:ABC-type transport system involved in multi-copper enzyme maturation permease subunit